MPKETSVIDRLIEPVGRCLTPEVANRIASLQADRELHSRVDELAEAGGGLLWAVLGNVLIHPDDHEEPDRDDQIHGAAE